MSKPQLRRLRRQASRAAKRRANRKRTLTSRRPLVFEQLEDRRVLAAVGVSTTFDVLDGDTSSIANLISTPGADGAISLREAVIASNNTVGADTINLPAGTYTLSIPNTLPEDLAATGDLDITDSVSIVGATAASTIINGASLDRVFHIPFTGAGSSLMVNFQDITITNGLATDSGGSFLTGAAGGGINNSEPAALITISDSVITQNVADGTGLGLEGQGGGLADFGGNLTLSNTMITNNQAKGEAGLAAKGGGIYKQNPTTALLIDSSISGNSAIGGDDIGSGAGVGQGGGIYSDGVTWTMVGSTTVDSNQALGGNGSGLAGSGGGDAAGGGIYDIGGTWDLTLIPGSTISRNEAIGGDGDSGGDAFGGGIFGTQFSTWNLENNTISGNSALGGAGVSLSGGDAFGGGVYSTNFGTFTVTYLTIADNHATGGAGGGTGNGGGFFSDDFNGSFVSPLGTIFGLNTASTLNPDVADSFGAGFFSSGYNLIGDVGSTPWFAGPGDLVGPVMGTPIDPLLGALMLNGGPTETHLPMTGSPAIDMGDPVLFPMSDQRGMMRPADGDGDTVAIADIGSVEVAAAMGGASIDIEKFTNGLNADSPTGPLIAVGGTATFTYVVSNTGSVALTSVAVLDDQLGAITNLISNGNGDTILDPMESWTYQATTVVTPGQYTNTGTVTADDPSLNPVTDMDSSNHFGVVPQIEIEKRTLDGTTTAGNVIGDFAIAGDGNSILMGEDVTWIYQVKLGTDDGSVPLENISVTDSEAGVTPVVLLKTGGNADNVLEIGEAWYYTAAGTAVAGNYTNTGTVVADDATNTVTGTFTANDGSSYTGADPQIEIDKRTLDGTTTAGTVVSDFATAGDGVTIIVGDPVTWIYQVTLGSGPGNVPLSNISVIDSETGVTPAVLLKTGGNMDNVLESGETWYYTAAGTAIADDYSNTGTASGSFTDDAGDTRSDTETDDSSYFGALVSIDIQKFTNGVDADSNTDPLMPQIAPGDPVNYTYEVRNTGNVPLSNVVVEDDNGTPLVPGDDFNPPPVLSGGFNVGDTNMNNLLDFELSGDTEVWQYAFSTIALDLNVVIDFDTDGLGAPINPGDIIDNEYANFGLTIFGDELPITGMNRAMAFDSANTTVDLDLGTPNTDFGGVGVGAGGSAGALGENRNPQGNILIVSDDLNPVTPNSADRGTVTFDWGIDAVRINSVQLLDLETGDNSIDLFDSGGTLISSITSFANTGNNGFQIVVINEPFVSKMVINFGKTTGPLDKVGIAQIDFDRTLTNLATATGTFNPTVSATDPSNYRNPLEAAIDIEKATNAADPSNPTAAEDADTPTGPLLLTGTQANFSYLVTAPGDVPFAPASGNRDMFVVDDHGTPGNTADDFYAMYVSGDLLDDGILAPGETWIYQASILPITPGQYTNTGSVEAVDVTDPFPTPVTVSDPSNHFGADPQIEIEKRTLDGTTTAGTVANDFTTSVTDGANILVGEDVTWIYQVTLGSALGSVPLSNISVTDSGAGVTPTLLTGDDGDNVLEDGETWYYTAVGMAALGQYDNIGTASGSFTDDAGVTRTDIETDTSSYFGADPQIAIEKRTLDGITTAGTVASDFATNATDGANILVGEAVTWIYQVTSVGNVDLSNVSVTDDQSVSVSLLTGDDGDNVLEDGEIWYFTATGMAVAGSYNNIGMASGSFTDSAGDTGTDTETDASSYFGANPQIRIEKRTLDGTTTAASVAAEFATAGDGVNILVGEDVTWIYQVTSVGNVDLSSVSVTDDQGVTVSLLTGDDGDNVLEGGEVWYFTATGTAVAGSYNNIGEAGGSFTDDAGHIGTDTESDASSYFGADPQIAVEKRTLDGTTTAGTVADDFATAGDGINIAVGEAVTWIYQVTSVGNVDLSNVSVTDDQGVTVSLLTGDDGDNVLEGGEVWYFTATGTAVAGLYNNVGTASGSFTDTAGHTGTDTETDASSYFGVEEADNIKIEKFTNGVNADDPLDAPEISPGSPVTWTYEVTTAGPGFVPGSAIEIVDDAGTPGDTGDDFSISSGDILFISGDDGDGNLEVGETWIYEAEGIAQDLSTPGASTTFILTGNSALDGPNGNIRTFSSGGIDLKASAFSRDSYGVWETAWLGAYSPGLGVTDNSEGNGGDGLHRVDNVHRLNYVLFAFSESVIVDRAFLDSVVNDSDLSIWVGTIADAFTNPVMLNDAVLNSLDLNEVNNTTSSYARWADFNSGEVAGNVLVLAASVEDPTPEDRFKIRKLDVREAGIGVYENIAVVTAGDLMDDDLSHYTNPVPNPDIDIEKFTNGVNADSPSEAPQIAPGAPVYWTYEVTNTGNMAFAQGEVVIVDDAGTPDYAGDDFSTTSGGIVLDTGTDVGSDGILSPGEMWTYSALGIAQDLSGTGATITFQLTGNSALDGPNGNIRTFSTGGVSVNTSGFSRDSYGVWEDAYLGAYSSGLGVTDNSEGDGSNGLHRVDNVHRENYVLFAFSEDVIVDRTFLDSVVNDSDITLWIGTIADAFTNSVTLSDAVLSGLDVFEVNNTTSSSSRWADINAGEVSGNVLVLAASTVDSTPEDRFKIRKLEVEEVVPGIYKNTAVVTAGAGGTTDSDMSHYRNPDGDIGVVIEKRTNGSDADDSQGADVPVIDPGDPVYWTYFVTNTGDVDLDFDDVVVSDNHGTPGDTSDDFMPVFDAGSDVGGDLILSPGETWEYFASDTADILLTVINFDDLAAGTLVNEQYEDVGLTISTNDPEYHPAMIFDSQNPTGGDTDLVTPGYGENNDVALGKILIISEDGDQSDPDDNASGGTLIFEFDQLVRVNRIDILDIDHGETGGTVKTFDSANNLISTHTIADLGDNSFQSIGIGDEGVSRLEVKLVGSGAVTELSFDRIYSNIATVTVNAVSDSDPSHYRNPPTPIDSVVASKRFFVVDTYTDKSFEYDSDGTPLENNPLAYGNYAPSGITMTVDGQTNWVVDRSKNVFVYDEDGDNFGQWAAGGLSSPEGIATNETDIWIVDDGLNKVFFYAGAASRLSGSQGPSSSFTLAAGNEDPSGITMFDQTIWVVNDGECQDDVFVYDLGGNLQGSWTLAYSAHPRGITINPGDVNDIWIVDAHYDVVNEYTGGAFFTSGTYKPNARWALDSYNHSPEGIADPPPPVLQSSAKDLALASFVPFLDQVAEPTLAAPLDNAAVTRVDDRSYGSEAQLPAPPQDPLYASVEAEKGSLFGDRVDELDAGEKEDDAALDAFFAKLGDAEDDPLGAELISAR